MDVFIFTMGLTEAWIDKRNGRVYPTAPGTIAGSFDPKIHAFHNFSYNEIYDDFLEFLELVRNWNPGFRVILTVSPVPLTATASGRSRPCRNDLLQIAFAKRRGCIGTAAKFYRLLSIL